MISIVAVSGPDQSALPAPQIWADNKVRDFSDTRDPIAVAAIALIPARCRENSHAEGSARFALGGIGCATSSAIVPPTALLTRLGERKIWRTKRTGQRCQIPTVEETTPWQQRQGLCRESRC